MTDWGAHHFGGATFAIDVRELEPVEVIYHDDKDVKYLTYRYENGQLLHHNCPNMGNLEVVGTPGEKRAAQAVAELPRPGRHLRRLRALLPNTRQAVPRHRICDPYHGSLPSGSDRLRVEAIADMGPGKQEFPGDEEANRFLDRARREPWVL